MNPGVRLGTALHILLLEDSAADADLVAAELERAGLPATFHCVDSAEAYGLALRDSAPDVVLSDHALAQFNARAALELLRALRPAVPLIVVAGQVSDESAVALVRAGAADIVSKDRLGRLPQSISTALAARAQLRTLSPRQLEVIILVSEGRTSTEIAHRLGVGVKTIESHRGEAMRRLGLRDLAGLVRYAVRFGLIVP